MVEKDYSTLLYDKMKIEQASTGTGCCHGRRRKSSFTIDMEKYELTNLKD